MYHSSDFFDLLQLNLKLLSIFPKFMETKSLITIQNRGKEKELDKNKSWYVPWQPPFGFILFLFQNLLMIQYPTKQKQHPKFR